MTPTVLLLSYSGPESHAAGFRIGRLARAIAEQRLCVTIVHADEQDGEYEWKDGVRARSFRRTDPSGWRNRRRTARARSGSVGALPRRSTVGRTLRRLIRAVLQPDEMILSALPFYLAAVQECRRLQLEGHQPVLLTSGPPWSTLLVGRRAAARCGVPLLLDFQDLWSFNPVGQMAPLAGALARWLEQDCLMSADGIVFVNQAVAARYLERYPALAMRPTIVAPIGFRGEPPSIMTVRSGSRLVIGHFGSLYRDRSLGQLLEACEAASSPDKMVVVEWYGEMQDESRDRAKLLRFLKTGQLVMHGLISHEEAQARMRECDLLLTVPSPSYPEELTTKFYDYLDAGRPVLALARSGSLLSDLVSKGGVGRAFAPDDQAGMELFLRACLGDGQVFRPNRAMLAPHGLGVAGAAVAQLVTQVLDQRK